MGVESEKILFKWADYQYNIIGCFEELQKDADFTDVTLVSGEDYHIEAHRIILSACSPFFRSILKKNQHTHPMIYMKGLKTKDMVAIVEYIYHGEASIFQEDLDGFLALAEELQLRGLESSNSEEGVKEGKPIIKLVETVPGNQKSISTVPFPYNSDDSVEYLNISNLNTSSAVLYKGKMVSDTDAEYLKSEIDSMVEICNGKEEPNQKITASKPKRKKFSQQNTIKKGDVQEIELKKYGNTPIILKNSRKNRLPVESNRKEHNVKIDSMIEYVDNEKLKFKCTVCGKVTAQKGDINRHVETHMKGLAYPCKICGKVKKSKNALNAHMSFHKGLSYPCTVCGEVKKSKFALTSHLSCHAKKGV